MEDISNIRVTDANNNFLQRLVSDLKLFKDDKTAAMFAVSYALSNNLDENVTDADTLTGATINKWDAASVDATGVYQLLIKLKHPESTCPYRMLQSIMNIGLQHMLSKVPENGFVRISEFMKKD